MVFTVRYISVLAITVRRISVLAITVRYILWTSMTSTSFVFTELANTMKYGGGLLYNLVFTRQTDRQTDSFIPPIYNTIWWGRLLLRHKHMSLSKEPPYNNDKQWITLYIKYTYRPVMWVRKLLSVTYWTGRSGKWLCYSLKTVQMMRWGWIYIMEIQ